MSYFSASQTEKLLDYLHRIRVRLQVTTASRGLGATAIVALLVTVFCVYIANRFAFSDSSVVSARTLLFGSVVAIVVFALIRPLMRLGRGNAAGHLEKSVPAFDGRIETFVDQSEPKPGKKPNPFLDLLAEDTMRVAEAAPVEQVVEAKRIFGYALAAAGAAVFLMWLGSSGPGYWSYGTARLWGGWLKPAVSPLYQIVVEPKDTTIRQGADLIVTAQMAGFESPTAQLFAKFDSSVQWEEAPMQRQMEGTGFEFLFAGVREPFRYYITAGGIESEEFEVQVVEMPNVEAIRLTYHYPKWTGLESLVEEDLGDIRAVAGTEVEVQVKTDKPLTGGLLRVNDDSSVSMSAEGLEASGRIQVEKEGHYFVAAMYKGEVVRLTNDYFISVIPDKKPTVRFLRPGRDSKATSIEEVVTQFEAGDDFGLRSFEVNYSVNGGDTEKAVLKIARGSKKATAGHTFYLEEMGGEPDELRHRRDQAGDEASSEELEKLLPGDIISYYGVARDAKTATQTDMYFIEVRPYDFEVVQGQSGGAMGEAGQPQEEISRRQKEIISGTWNLIKNSADEDKRTRAEVRDNALMLSEIQLTLRDQARTLAERVRARDLAGTNEDFKAFVENFEKATEQMAPAAELLKAGKLRDALSPQQKALQYLRRAEAIFRRIEVTQGGRGGGGGGQASRDLSEMFELEMDLEKNQYETGGGASSEQLDREIDEALDKLSELAKRQEKLAERAQRQQAQTFAQRWQQEVLRREAEELKRKLEELQRREQAKKQESGQQQGQQGDQQQASQSQQGARSGGSRLEQTIRRLEEATRDMQGASQAGGRQQGGNLLNQRQVQARSQRAQERLQEALRAMEQERRERTNASIAEMVRRADKLAQQQGEAAQTLRKALDHALEYIKQQGGQQRGKIPSGMSAREEIELANRKGAMQQQVEAIERMMQEAARQSKGSETSRKLREALSDLQQSELGLRLQQAAQYVRQGYAAHIAQREGAVTEAIGRLQDQLREADRLAQAGGGGDDQGLERTLARIEDMRRQLEEAAGRGRERERDDGEGGSGDRAQRQGPGGWQQGQQPGEQGQGQGQQGQQQGQQGQGQGPGQQAGMGQGQQGQGQQSGGQSPSTQGGDGQRGGQFGPGGQSGGQQNWDSASNFGRDRRQGFGGPLDPQARREMERAMRDSARLLPSLTQQLRGQGIDEQELNEIRRFVAGLPRDRFPGNPKLLQQEHRTLLSLLEQLELQVRRQVEQDKGGNQIRAISNEPVPEQYREAVAEYFRRLSQGR